MQIIKFIIAAFLMISGLAYVYIAIKPFSILLLMLGIILFLLGLNIIRITRKQTRK